MRTNMFSFFCLIVCGIFVPLSAAAFPYQPVTSLEIISEVSADLNESGTPDSAIWRVDPETAPGEEKVTLSFFKANSDLRLCRLVVSASGAIRDVDIPGIRNNMVIQENDLLVVPGFPVPCTILPFQLMAGKQSFASKLYHVKRSAGTQVFADTLEVQTYPATWAVARANGWINSSLSKEQKGPLQVLKVVNHQSGELVVLQLWETGADWWMYEKTPFRQSWRLP